MDGAGITSAQIDAALDPAGYLGSAAAFTDAALDGACAAVLADGLIGV